MAAVRPPSRWEGGQGGGPAPRLISAISHGLSTSPPCTQGRGRKRGGAACRFLTEKNKTQQNKKGRGGEVGRTSEAPHLAEGGVGEPGKESESRPLLLPGGRVPRARPACSRGGRGAIHSEYTSSPSTYVDPSLCVSKRREVPQANTDFSTRGRHTEDFKAPPQQPPARATCRGRAHGNRLLFHSTVRPGRTDRSASGTRGAPQPDHVHSRAGL